MSSEHTRSPRDRQYKKPHQATTPLDDSAPFPPQLSGQSSSSHQRGFPQPKHPQKPPKHQHSNHFQQLHSRVGQGQSQHTSYHHHHHNSHSRTDHHHHHNHHHNHHHSFSPSHLNSNRPSHPHQQQQRRFQQAHPSAIPFNKKKNKQMNFGPGSQNNSNAHVESSSEAKLYMHAVPTEATPEASVDFRNPQLYEPILLKHRSELFSFDNPYEPPNGQHIPDRVWMYNPETGQPVNPDPTYTFNSSTLRSGIPLFPSCPSTVAPRTSTPTQNFSVMAYNVLSSLHISENEYRSTPPNILSAKSRVPKVFSQIAALRPTFVALQEVDCPFNTYIPLLNSLGYQGTFKLRRNNQRQISGEGLVLAWNAAEWNCLAQGGVEYSSYPNPSMCKEQLALVALLQQNTSTMSLDATTTPPTGKNICLVTTHIIFNPKRINTKSGQLQMMLNGVYAWLADLQLESQQETEIQVVDGSGATFHFPGSDAPEDASSLESKIQACSLSPTKSGGQSLASNPNLPTAETQAYHTSLLNQFQLNTADLSSLFRPVVITSTTPQFTEHPVGSRMQTTTSNSTQPHRFYGAEYTLQPGHFLIPTLSTDSPQQLRFSQLDLQSSKAQVVNIQRLDSSTYSLTDIFSPSKHANQRNPTFDFNQPVNPVHLINSTSVYQPTSIAPTRYNPLLDPSHVARLESVDFNNYVLLARAMHLNSLQFGLHDLTEPTSVAHNSPLHPRNRALKKQHARDVNTMLSNAINCIELRIYMESTKGQSQDPTTYLDHSLFQHLSHCNLMYNNLVQPASLSLNLHQTHPIIENTTSPLLPLLFHSPPSGEKLQVALTPETSIDCTRLPPQTTLTHKDRPIDKSLQNITTSDPNFHVQTLLPHHHTSRKVNRHRAQGLKRVFQPSSAQNSAVVFTGDFNASVDSSFVNFLAGANPLDVNDAILKTSPTFIGIELEKNAKAMLRDMNALCYQRLCGAIKTAINHISKDDSIPISCKIPPRSRHDFDPEIIQSQNACFVYLITHAFTSGLHTNNISSLAKTSGVGGFAPTSIKQAKSNSTQPSSSSQGVAQQPHENDLLSEQVCYAILRELYDFYFTTLTDAILSLRNDLLSGSARNSYLASIRKQQQNKQPNQQQSKSFSQGLAEASSILSDQINKKNKPGSSSAPQPSPPPTQQDSDDFSTNPLFLILSPIVQNLGQQEIRQLQQKFNHLIFIRSIFIQFIYQHSTTLLAVDPNIDFSISQHSGRSGPEFKSILKSLRAPAQSGPQVIDLTESNPPKPPHDTEQHLEEFLDQLETSFSMTSDRISTHISELLHANSTHTSAIRHPLMSLCYDFATQYTKSFFKQLTVSLAAHTKLFPLPTMPKYAEYPRPINPFDTSLNITTPQSPSRPLHAMIHPFGPLQLPYQQPYLPRQFRFSSVQERGKTVVDHILISQHDIPTLLNNTPNRLHRSLQSTPAATLSQPPASTSSPDPNADLSQSSPLAVRGVLGMVADEVAVSKKYFLPDTREGSDHLSIVASLQWKQ